MRTRLPALALLALLTACGSSSDVAPFAAPSPSPSPSPTGPLFTVAEAGKGLLAPADVAGYTPLPAEFQGALPPKQVSLCAGTATPPPVPGGAGQTLQGAKGFDAVTEHVAVLPTEAVAAAVLAAVQRHATTCEPHVEEQIRGGFKTYVSTTTRAAAVPLVSGGWSGVRQSSTSTYGTAAKGATQRWSTQHVLLRRSNAVLDLEVAGESAPPDLQAVLAKALAKLDALA